ncbi:MAG: AraC family transcriptional regulator [Spirochaetaceae bacterium]
MILHIEAIQRVIDYIDLNLTEDLNVDKVASESNISKFHFQRVFSEIMGLSVSRYITIRRFQFALYDISMGKKITDIAFHYGFESHAGFSRAFKRVFGYSPSFYRKRSLVKVPKRLDVSYFYENYKAVVMEPKIVYRENIVIAGNILKEDIGKSFTRDVPVFYEKCASMEDIESNLNYAYKTLTPKIHGEFCLAIKSDNKSESYSYFVGIRVDDDTKLTEKLKVVTIPDGDYVLFTTPWTKEENSIETTRITWRYILDEWFPKSDYEIDETRYDYEYEDERVHSWDNGGKSCMDIVIPVIKR